RHPDCRVTGLAATKVAGCQGGRVLGRTNHRPRHPDALTAKNGPRTPLGTVLADHMPRGVSFGRMVTGESALFRRHAMTTTYPMLPFTSLDDLLGALDGIVRIDAGGGPARAGVEILDAAGFRDGLIDRLIATAVFAEGPE